MFFLTSLYCRFCSDPSYDCSPQRSPLDYHSQQGPKTDQYYPGRPPHPTVQWRASSFQTGYESFGHPANRNAENPRPGGPVRVSENYDPSSRYAPGVQAPHGNANNNFRLASYPGQPSRFPQPGAPDTPAGQRGLFTNISIFSHLQMLVVKPLLVFCCLKWDVFDKYVYSFILPFLTLGLIAQLHPPTKFPLRLVTWIYCGKRNQFYLPKHQNCVLQISRELN